jgi:hypothetical protein
VEAAAAVSATAMERRERHWSGMEWALEVGTGGGTGGVHNYRYGAACTPGTAPYHSTAGVMSAAWGGLLSAVCT